MLKCIASFIQSLERELIMLMFYVKPQWFKSRDKNDKGSLIFGYEIKNKKIP
jgi:hypothetical protein